MATGRTHLPAGRDELLRTAGLPMCRLLAAGKCCTEDPVRTAPLLSINVGKGWYRKTGRVMISSMSVMQVQSI